jgi:hypothetical protein
MPVTGRVVHDPEIWRRIITMDERDYLEGVAQDLLSEEDRELDRRISVGLLRLATEEAMRRHKEGGVPMVGMKDGKIFEVAPEDIVVEGGRSYLRWQSAPPEIAPEVWALVAAVPPPKVWLPDSEP